MQQLQTFANEILSTLSIQGEVWTIGKDYKTGDIVYGDLQGVMTDQQFQCRQAPFGDFCGQYNPLSQEGINAWRSYSELSGPLPEPNPRQVKCISEDAARLITNFKSGDKICQGRYVWKCRDVSKQDWCNTYPVGSEYANLAWVLLDALPESTN
jgi:hypothetical protein